ncbi:MAG: RNA polymerase sigma factor [Acidimicrobiales bacterium]
MDEKDFDGRVRRHAGAVSAYARALAPDRWIAEEAVQETFLRAWRYRDRFDGRGSFEGWLLRICRNCLIDLAAKRPPTEPLPEHFEAPAALDERHEIYAMLETLPLAQREVLVLCGLLGYDYDGAAELLGVPVGTVRSRLHRGRAAMAALLEPDTGVDAAQQPPGGSRSARQRLRALRSA